jgi:hypothetical protein
MLLSDGRAVMYGGGFSEIVLYSRVNCGVLECGHQNQKGRSLDSAIGVADEVTYALLGGPAGHSIVGHR